MWPPCKCRGEPTIGIATSTLFYLYQERRFAKDGAAKLELRPTFSHGVPALTLEIKSKGALAYLALAGEVVRRMEQRMRPPVSAAQESNDQPEQR